MVFSSKNLRQSFFAESIRVGRRLPVKLKRLEKGAGAGARVRATIGAGGRDIDEEI